MIQLLADPVHTKDICVSIHGPCPAVMSGKSYLFPVPLQPLPDRVLSLELHSVDEHKYVDPQHQTAHLYNWAGMH